MPPKDNANARLISATVDLASATSVPSTIAALAAMAGHLAVENKMPLNELLRVTESAWREARRNQLHRKQYKGQTE